MPDDAKSIEIRIQNAIDTLQRDKSRKISDLAKEFAIPYHRLYSRLNGKKTRVQNCWASRALTKPQEEAVKQWLDQLDKAGQAPNAERIQICANSILRRQHSNPQTSPPTVSKMWAYRFMNRLPEDYKRLRTKPKEPKRLQSEDVARIQLWYERFERLIRQHQIQPTDLYNMDEVGFMDGLGRPELVITKYPERNHSIGSAYSRGLITILECVSASGDSLPPYILLSGKGHLEDWYTQSSMPGPWRITTTDNGFTNDEVGFQWLMHFDEYSKKRQVCYFKFKLI